MAYTHITHISRSRSDVKMYLWVSGLQTWYRMTCPAKKMVSTAQENIVSDINLGTHKSISKGWHGPPGTPRQKTQTINVSRLVGIDVL